MNKGELAQSQDAKPPTSDFVKLKQVNVKKRALWPQVKHVIVETALHSTGHGVPNIFRTDITFLKLAWLVFITGAMAGCAYVTTRSIISYLNYDVVTTFRTYYQNPMEFPMVTICNENSLISPNATAYSKTFYDSLSDTNGFLTRASAAGDPSFLRFIITMLSSSPAYDDLMRKSFTIPFDYFLLDCLFNLQPCTEDDFDWYYSVQYGNCYRFNSGKNSSGLSVPIKMTKKQGETVGLSLTLFVPQPTSFYSFSTSLGANILISNQSEMMSFDKGFPISIGTETKIILDREFTHREPAPFSDCVQTIESLDSVLVKYFVKNGLNYKKQDCLNLCYQRKVVDVCGCYSLMYPMMTFGHSACDNLNKTICSVVLYTTFFNEEAALNCSKDCPQECDSTSYKTSISYLDYPNHIYAESLYNNSIFREAIFNFTGEVSQSDWYSVLKNNLISLSVYYNELTYTLVEESPKFEITDLISNIGGTIGLFLGMSFLSFCELFEMIVEILVVIRRGRKLQNNETI